MGIMHSWTDTNVYFGIGAWNLETSVSYQPLYDDAQAMELVKRFRLDIAHCDDATVNVFYYFKDERTAQVETNEADLNRAIVYAVAAKQAASVPNYGEY